MVLITSKIVRFINLSTTMLLVLLICFDKVEAQTDITIRGAGRLFPIAVPRLCIRTDVKSLDTKEESVRQTSAEQYTMPNRKKLDNIARKITDRLVRNLDWSGFFEVLNADTFIESADKCFPETGFAYSDWSVIGAEGLVKGDIGLRSDGQYIVRLFLHDVVRQKVVLGKEYIIEESQSTDVSHKFGNEIMKFFTGYRGVFGSKIAYVSRVGRFKELFLMDIDGGNIRQISFDKGLVVSPSWHPSGEKIIYTSYRNRVPDLFELDLYTGNLVRLTKGLALELGAEYSPITGDIIMSKTYMGESDIGLLDPSGAFLRSVTAFNGAIDVSPTFSPDGKRIAFCSNRAGGPQIYVMDLDGGKARRISFVNSDYCTSPSWSPVEDRILFVCKADMGYQIFSTTSSGTNTVQLTTYGNNEDPSWSPNGQYVVYATNFGKGYTKKIAIMRKDGTSIKQITFGSSDDSQPVWGPVPKHLR